MLVFGGVVVFVGGFGNLDLRPFIMPHFFLTGLEWKARYIIHENLITTIPDAMLHGTCVTKSCRNSIQDMSVGLSPLQPIPPRPSPPCAGNFSQYTGQ